MILRTFIFLLINFTGLFIGGLFTGEGVPSDWYQNLNKAPWTPPGWVFGAAWTTIMACFSLYLSLLWKKINSKQFIYLYSTLLILNIIWNPLFFYFRLVLISQISITFLTFMIGYTFLKFKSNMKFYNLLLIPYLAWLVIATSLNAFIFIYN